MWMMRAGRRWPIFGATPRAAYWDEAVNANLLLLTAGNHTMVGVA